MDRKESSLDIYAFLSRYRSLLDGAFIKKVYHIPPKLFILQINSPGTGRIDLYMSLEKGIYTSTKIEDVQPTQTALNLRKILQEKKIQRIEQINFDRVVKIRIHPNISVIIELFREGNLIVTVDDKIEFAVHQREWKNRKIIKGEIYLPPSQFDPITSRNDEIEKILSGSSATVVQTLATRMNLGGDLAEELCYRAGIDKSTPAKESTEFIAKLRDQLQSTLGESEEGKCYVYDNQGIISPVRLNHLGEEPSLVTDDFNAEIGKRMVELIEESAESISMKKRIESQQKTIEEYEAKSILMFHCGTIIMSRLKEMNRIISDARMIDSREGNRKLPENAVLDRAKKTVDLTIDDAVISLDIRKSAGENADEYFISGKDYKKRIENARIALQESIKSTAKEGEKRKARKRKFWFEKYRWTFTSEGNLVIAGRDRKTNETAVKKHMESSDIYVHADLYGAPSTIVKSLDGKRPEQKSIEEACAFAVSFSRAWSAGISSGSAYWVYPEQVSKSPESGEYVSTGSWIIRGKRNYVFSLPLVIYLAPIEYQGDSLMMASTVSENPMFSENAIKIMPGKASRGEIVRKISDKYSFVPDDVDPVIPPGGSIIQVD